MKVEDIKNIAVIGAGNMGHQIAALCAINGYKTVCMDTSQEKKRVNTDIPPDPSTLGERCLVCDSLSDIQKAKIKNRSRNKPKKDKFSAARNMNDEEILGSDSDDSSVSVSQDFEKSLLGDA